MEETSITEGTRHRVRFRGLLAVLALPTTLGVGSVATSGSASADDSFVIDFGYHTRPHHSLWFVGTGGNVNCNRHLKTVTVSSSAAFWQTWYSASNRELFTTDRRYVTVGYELWGAPAGRPRNDVRLAKVPVVGYGWGAYTRTGTHNVPSNWSIWVKVKGKVWNGQAWLDLKETQVVAPINCTV